MTVEWVRFTGTYPKGERRRGSLEQFGTFLTTRHRAYAKELAPGFSATSYLDHYTHEFFSKSAGEMRSFEVDAPSVWRSNAGVASLSALVLDLDHAEPDWERLETTGNLIIAWNTWSHSPADPHWRLVAPFAIPGVAVDEWPSAFALGLDRFEPRSDTSCEDPSHLFWLPAGPPDKAIDIRVLAGDPWAPSGLTTRPPEPSSWSLGVASDRAATTDEQAAALRMLDATCRKLAQHPDGGRQVAAYGHARHVGHLIAANALDEETALDALWRAVAAETGNGVGDERAAETRRALRRGLAKGVADGAYVFEDEAVIRIQPLRERPVRRVLRVQVR